MGRIDGFDADVVVIVVFPGVVSSWLVNRETLLGD